MATAMRVVGVEPPVPTPLPKVPFDPREITLFANLTGNWPEMRLSGEIAILYSKKSVTKDFAFLVASGLANASAVGRPK